MARNDPSEGTDEDDLDDEEMDEEALRDAIESLERQLADCEDEVESLEARRGNLETSVSERRAFPDDVHETMRAVGKEARASVVALDDPDHHFRANGTGWVVDDGVLVTARSVVAGPRADVVEGWEGPVPDGPETLVPETIDGRELPIEGTTIDERAGVALVETATDGLDPLSSGSTDGLEDGDPLLVLGHPAQLGRWVMTLGRYAGADGTDRFRVDAPVSHATTGQGLLVPPIAGAPVFDLGGTVVGVVEGTRLRADDLAPGAHTKSETPLQRLPDTYDLLAVDGGSVRD